MKIEYNTHIATQYGSQSAVVNGYIRAITKSGPAKFNRDAAVEALGMPYQAVLRCRSRLRVNGYIQDALDPDGFLWVARPEQEFPFTPRPAAKKIR